MGEKEDILKLREMIPTFECIEGCTDCCGIVPFTPFEWNNILVHKTHTDFNCPYITGDGCHCSIYDDRPIICRLFGTVKRLSCPHGRKPEVMLTPKQEKEILDIYLKYEPSTSKTTFAGISAEQAYTILRSGDSNG